MNKKCVAIFQPSSSMSAGSTQSAIQLAIDLKQDGLDCFLILFRHGNIEGILSEKNLEYYVINDYANNAWTMIQGTNTKSIKFLLEHNIKRVLNFIQVEKAIRLCYRKKVDLIHVNTMTCCQGAIVAKRMGIPLFWHIREFMEEDLGVEFCNPTYAANVMKRADCIIAVSKAVKDKFASYVPKNKIRVVYNGVNPNKYYIDKDIFCDSKITISITGRVNRKKCQHELLGAISLLPLEIRNRIRCLIVGESLDKDYDRELKKIVLENDLDNIVEFVGFTDRIEDYLKITDVLCVCSIREAFGRTTVEGMQAGCLVLGANSGGTRELIEDGITGVLYESGNSQDLAKKLQYITENVSTMRGIAKHAQKEAIIRFSDKNNAKAITEIYKEYCKW